MISILVALLVFVLLLWVVRTILPMLALPEPASTVIYVVLVVILALYLLRALGLITTI